MQASFKREVPKEPEVVEVTVTFTADEARALRRTLYFEVPYTFLSGEMSRLSELLRWATE